MPKTIFTTTISLPRSMAAVLKTMTRQEGRTTSELVREALRHYERAHHALGQRGVQWSELRRKLKRVSQAGRSINLATFIARDRMGH